MTPQALAMLAAIALGIVFHIRAVRAARPSSLASGQSQPTSPPEAKEAGAATTPAAPVFFLDDYRLPKG